MTRESNKEILEKPTLKDLFRKGKDKIGDEDLRPLRDYRDGSLEEAFYRHLEGRLDRTRKNWLRKQGNLRETIRKDRQLRKFGPLILGILILVVIGVIVGINQGINQGGGREISDTVILFVTVVLVGLIFIGRHWYREFQSRIYKNEGQYLKVTKQFEDNTTNIVRLALAEFKTRHDLNEWPWRMRVPRYTGDNPCKYLVERHDDYSTTDVFRLAKQYIETHDRGSLGVAGERGAGKTSMMSQLRRALDPHSVGQEVGSETAEEAYEHNFHTVWMSAPTKVEEKEFLVSVLAKLATSVGIKLTGNKNWPNEPFDTQKMSVMSLLGMKIWGVRRGFKSAVWKICKSAPVVAFIALLAYSTYLALFALYLNLELKPSSRLDSNIPYIVIVVNIAIMVIASVVLTWKLSRSYIRRVLRFISRSRNKTEELIVISADLLEELWYERKDMSSSNVSLSPSPFGPSASVGSGRERKREPFTLPHLVDMWDKYIEFLTSKDGGLFQKVVVFIDEIDKLKETDKIAECMLILKALYNPQNLLFVVSVSEDAYKQFEKRPSSLEDRNEFDSSVDHSVWIGKIKCDELRTLINNRMLGYPFSIPVIQFVWMLSKGNPRDAIRLARSIPKHDEGRSLKDIVKQLFPRILGMTVDTYRRGLNLGYQNFPLLNQLCVQKAMPSPDLRVMLAESITEVMRLMSRGSMRQNDRMSYSMLLAELTYSQLVCELFYTNSDLSQCIVLYKCNRCRKMIEEVQNHLSKRNAEHALQLLGYYYNYMKRRGAVELDLKDLREVILSLLVDAGNGLTQEQICEQMGVHLGGMQMRVGKALCVLEKNRVVKCRGEGSAARWTLMNVTAALEAG